MKRKLLVIGAAAVAFAAAAAELSEAEVDKLCPPRAETAAAFKAGAYPPAARPYREAALKAFAYMASLPAMRTLVEKGEPEQTYQHNAYVSKTHAAHINLMLEWARREPARRAEAMRFVKASAEYLLTQLEPPDAPLAWWPPTYGRKPLRRDPSDGGRNRPSMVGNEPEGAVKYRGEVMLLYPADVGAAFVAYYRETHDRRFLDAARGIGETYLKIRRPDGSWPLKMRLATGEPIGENTLVPTKPLAFFNALAEATGDDRWAKASDACFAWLEAHPLTDWNWDGQFEDIQPRPPYANPTKHNAVDAMFEILRRFPGDKARLEQCRRILRFCEKRFVCWERPANHPKWDVPSVLEQYSCFVPIDASAAKMIRAYLALWKVTGEPELLAKARTLGDTITRVQTPEGRIPTFWMHDTLGQPIYDWLNCMGSSAAALLELADAQAGGASGPYDVAAFVWPAYQPEPRWAELGIFKAGKGEWQNVWEAVPKWEGHRQPLKPLWGYENEADPKVVAKKIDAAVAHGVNVFIYDWYWYGGRPFLEDALDKGFLGAPNNGKMKFFIMWANHDVNNGWDNTVAEKSYTDFIWRGTVSMDEFRTLVSRWIDLYFKRPNYYRIQGKPVLMVYDIPNFVKGLGGVENAAEAVRYLRTACADAGLGGAHFMACDYGLKPDVAKAVGIDSATIYNLVHWASPKGNPDYAFWAKAAAKRFDVAAKELKPAAFFAHASVGWDQNPRYPPGKAVPTVLGSTPAKFEVALRRAKDWTDRNVPPGLPKLVTINSWNEWTEGSYLEPDQHFGFGYLEAIRRVFCPEAAIPKSK